MLCESDPQEIMDLAPVAHLAAIKGRVPFLNFFDGFRTSHEIQKVAAWDYDDLATLVDFDAVRDFREHALNPEHPTLRGSHENGDIFFQNREACNTVYNELPAIVEDYMHRINAMIGTNYELFNYYGAPDADRVIVAMGSFCDVCEEVIDYLTARGEKVGLVKVRLYRPFVTEKFVAALPETVKKIAVLDRTKEPGAIGEPLYLDVVAALEEHGKTGIVVTGGRYGLGSDHAAGERLRGLQGMEKRRAQAQIHNRHRRRRHRSVLPEDPDAPNTADPPHDRMQVLGPRRRRYDRRQQANSIKIIGNHTRTSSLQAYFQYDSKKTGGTTVSHLRFGDAPIRSSYYVNKADFVACHNPSYITK